jgi:hypothetical protein
MMRMWDNGILIIRENLLECKFSWVVVSLSRLDVVSLHEYNEFGMQHPSEDKNEKRMST